MNQNSRKEIEASFKEAILNQVCPSCNSNFDSKAYDWACAYFEGRKDTLLIECDTIEKDGPFIIQCQKCLIKYNYCYFSNSIEKYKVSKT